MKYMELLQTIFLGLTLIAAVYIGQKQNEINETALKISNFSEVFLMPQRLLDENNKIVGWNVLIKNASAYPIYVNSYTLNGIKTDLGSSAIPNDSNSWYALVIPPDIQSKKEFSLLVSFEDYLGNKYQTEGFGKFEGGWNIHS